jgi:hypothetical protein
MCLPCVPAAHLTELIEQGNRLMVSVLMHLLAFPDQPREPTYMPRTLLHTRCCLFDMVPRMHTGPPTYFISHTWSRELGELLTLLNTRFGTEENEGEGVTVWLDIFAVGDELMMPGQLAPFWKV